MHTNITLPLGQIFGANRHPADAYTDVPSLRHASRVALPDAVDNVVASGRCGEPSAATGSHGGAWQRACLHQPAVTPPVLVCPMHREDLRDLPDMFTPFKQKVGGSINKVN